MKVSSQPSAQQSRHDEGTRTAREWLDYLVGGSCSLPTFLAGTGDLLRQAPDAGWDLLSLVDQYYRRGKISAELFGAVKAHLQGILVGKGPGGDGYTSVPTMQDEPTPVSMPVSAPAPTGTAQISVPI